MKPFHDNLTARIPPLANTSCDKRRNLYAQLYNLHGWWFAVVVVTLKSAFLEWAWVFFKIRSMCGAIEMDIDTAEYWISVQCHVLWLLKNLKWKKKSMMTSKMSCVLRVRGSWLLFEYRKLHYFGVDLVQVQQFVSWWTMNPVHPL